MKTNKIAVIAGAGPAGLTAAYELLHRTGIVPVIYEKTNDIGGISKTVNYKGNRIDIGGHRFFSKSDRVMDWWLRILPMEPQQDPAVRITYQQQSRNVSTDQPSSGDPDKVMLVRKRLSRIYYLKQFFNYPVNLSVQTISGLGLSRTVKIFCSYVYARMFPIRQESSLEDFFINRFGKALYYTFFKDYTEKVWGQSCSEISADWGAQRIKGLSVTKALVHAARSLSGARRKSAGVAQKGTETSLIERFLYPKYGPGQMWEEVAAIVRDKGGKIHMQHEVVGIRHEQGAIVSVTLKDLATGTIKEQACDYFFSTMPVRQLIQQLQPAPPLDIAKIAAGLVYRDFITVGLLLHKLKIRRDPKRPEGPDNLAPDNWIYIQEKEVKVGRLQLFNNWSPFMVQQPDHVWVGMEYFCNEGDQLWAMDDAALMQFAIDELALIDIIRPEDVLDSTVLRMEKAYPAYFGSYNQFDVLKNYTQQFTNLFLVGRNGMHKYNNSDHSMLSAMTAVDNLVNGRTDKQNIWDINTETDYHEEQEK